MRLLDLFCGAGGAAMGYHRAGFYEIVGVDIAPQPRYPFEFARADALEYLAEHGHEFDAIHASPPCQGYSIMHNLPWLRGRDYPLLLLPTLEMLEGLGKPYVVGGKARCQRTQEAGPRSARAQGRVAVRGNVWQAVLPAPSLCDQLVLARAGALETSESYQGGADAQRPSQPSCLP